MLLRNTAVALTLARLRACEAQLRAAQWDLERVCRRIYGQDAPPAGSAAVQININLRNQSDKKDVQAIDVTAEQVKS